VRVGCQRLTEFERVVRFEAHFLVPFTAGGFKRTLRSCRSISHVLRLMSKLNIQYVMNASAQSGVGHQAAEIARRLKGMPDVSLIEWAIDGTKGTLSQDGQKVAAVRSWPGVLGNKSVNWLRLGRHISATGPICHMTNQTLSFLAKKLQPSVVTVHDIIELLEPQDTKAYWLNRYLYSGITAANHIICVSEYTKKTVQEQFAITD
jgi:hypothetical protein